MQKPLSKYLDTFPHKYLIFFFNKPSVLEMQVVHFCGQPTLKVVPFDAKFHCASNSTSLRANSGKMANRAWKYLPKRPFGTSIGGASGTFLWTTHLESGTIRCRI